MTFDRNLLARARRELEQSVSAHRHRRELWREQLYTEQPRLRALDAQIRTVFLDALLSPREIEAATEKSLALQQERASLLRSMGASEISLDDTPLCPLCGDSGYSGREMCECLKERVRTLQTAELSSLLDLQGQTFDSFDAELFSDKNNAERTGSPRENIEIARDLCYNFCKRFSPQSENLLFSGSPGTGKTFLSACVAGVLSGRGISVVYDTAVRQLAQMEALQFGRSGEDTERAVERLRECDFLIIDDLGAEFITPFTQSALLDLINTRLISNKKMLISTNLDRAGIHARYSPALASRLEGRFLWLDFFGEDLRLKQR